MTIPVLSVRNLEVEFLTRRSTLRAINGVSFDIAKGEVLGVVGESGAGKSVTGLAVIGLIDPPGRISGGEIYLSGMRIDHLLVTPPLAARVVAAEIDREARKGPPIPSDHAPVVVDLDAQGKAFEAGWDGALSRIAARTRPRATRASIG